MFGFKYDFIIAEMGNVVFQASHVGVGRNDVGCVVVRVHIGAVLSSVYDIATQ